MNTWTALALSRTTADELHRAAARRHTAKVVAAATRGRRARR